MVTREALKTEIDVLPDESLDVLYRFIKFLETSLKELRVGTESRKKDSGETLNSRKQKFFEFINAYSFTLPKDYTFNREEIHER